MHSSGTASTGSASLQGQDSRVVPAVRAASEATGISFDYLLAQANQESGLDPLASSQSSSAAGLFQFTSSTWFDMVKRHGAEHGLSSYAHSITKGADGNWHVADKAARDSILALRRDPGISAMMAAEYAKDNGRVLEKKLGREASSSDLYLAHILGAGGAAKVLEKVKSSPTHEAAPLLPAAAQANPTLFSESGTNKPRSVASLYRVVQERLSVAMHHVAPVARKAELAALRPQPRPEEPLDVLVDAAPVIKSPDVPTQVAATPVPKANAPSSPYFPVSLPPAAEAARRPDDNEPFRA